MSELSKVNELINNNLQKSYELIKSNNIKEVKSLLEETISIIPNKESAGKSLFSFESALELWMYIMYFNPSIEINNVCTDNSSVYKLYGDVYMKSLNINEALKAYEKSLAWDPVRPDVIISIADIKKMNGDNDDYLSLLKNAIIFSKSPLEIAKAYYSIAKYYLEIKQYNNAVILYYLNSKFYYDKNVFNELATIKANYDVNVADSSNNTLKEKLIELDIPIAPSTLVLDALNSLGNEAKKNNSLSVYKFCKDNYSVLKGIL